MDLLSGLVEEYEEKYYPIKSPSLVEGNPSPTPGNICTSLGVILFLVTGKDFAEAIPK